MVFTLSYKKEDLSVEKYGEQNKLPLIGIKRSHIDRSFCQVPFLTAISIAFFGGAFLLFAASLTILAPSDLKCAMQLSSYCGLQVAWPSGPEPLKDLLIGTILAPMLEAVKYYEIDWANEFHQESIYRGSPTPKLDLAWDRLWRQNDINVPLSKLSSLNRSADANWKLTPAQYGGGAEANVEVFHQLHCLNMIRQYTYLDSYEVPPKGFRGSLEMSRTHVDHCIETLRIHLMCAGDVTPVLLRLDDSKPLGAEADFLTHHKCRRFDKLTEWMEMHALPAEER